MSDHQPLSTLSNFVFTGSCDLILWLWLASVSTPVCTHARTDTYIRARAHTHTNTVRHTVCSTSCVELSGWHHLLLQCQGVKGDCCLAALAPCPSAPLWVCVCVFVCVCCQRDSVTSLIKFGPLWGIYHVYIEYNNPLYNIFTISFILANSAVPSFKPASLLLFFLWLPPTPPLPPTSHSLLTSLCLLGTEWQNWVTWIVHTSQRDTYCVSVQPTECCTVCLQPSREQQWLIPTVYHRLSHYVYLSEITLLQRSIHLSYCIKSNPPTENNFFLWLSCIPIRTVIIFKWVYIGQIVCFLSSLHFSWAKNLRDPM